MSSVGVDYDGKVVEHAVVDSGEGVLQILFALTEIVPTIGCGVGSCLLEDIVVLCLSSILLE